MLTREVAPLIKQMLEGPAIPAPPPLQKGIMIPSSAHYIREVPDGRLAEMQKRNDLLTRGFLKRRSQAQPLLQRTSRPQRVIAAPSVRTKENTPNAEVPISDTDEKRAPTSDSASISIKPATLPVPGWGPFRNMYKRCGLSKLNLSHMYHAHRDGILTIGIRTPAVLQVPVPNIFSRIDHAILPIYDAGIAEKYECHIPGTQSKV